MSSVALSHLELLQKNFRHDAVQVPASDEHVMQWVGTSLGIAGAAI